MRRDVFSKAKRRQVMSSIRSRGSRLDSAMESLLTRSGLEFEAYPKLFGKPDFLVDPNIAVFCDSSFWHGRNWRVLRKKLLLSPDPDYWVSHISRNRARDREVTRKLARQGYLVIRFWEDDILKDGDCCISQIRNSLGVAARTADAPGPGRVHLRASRGD